MARTTRTQEPDAAGRFTPPETSSTPQQLPAGATADGTVRFRARHASDFAPGHFRAGANGLALSSMGIGTYLGADSDPDDTAYVDAIRCAITNGVNVIDTAINYRCQRSERAVGRALAQVATNGQVARDELVICTKAGYVPLENHPPATPEGYQGYLKREFYARRIMTPQDVVAGGHCLAPAFLLDCLDRSKANMGVARVDVFYVHNPEQQLTAVTPATLRERLRAAFSALESRVAAGDVGAYGVSTWQALRVPPGARGHLALADLVAVAHEVAGDGHHLRYVQMPASLAMPEAVRLPTQPMAGDRLVPAIEAAAALGLTVVTSAPLMQGGLAQGLPTGLAELFPTLTTDAQRAIAFVRSLPDVATTLVGMRTVGHVVENLGAAR